MYRMIGRVYVIYSESTGLAYYGSTVKTLKERFGEHESARRGFEKGTADYYSSFNVLDCGDAKIELVIEIDYDFEYELTEMEALYIRNYPCVNERIPNRTWVERYQNNREAILKKMKQYYYDNQEARLNFQKKYNQNNREQINKKHKEKHTCQCGGRYTYNHKSQHLNSNRHQQFLSQQTATLTAHEMRPLSPQLPSTSSLHIAV